jgi:hypothetical protein
MVAIAMEGVSKLLSCRKHDALFHDCGRRRNPTIHSKLSLGRNACQDVSLLEHVGDLGSRVTRLNCLFLARCAGAVGKLSELYLVVGVNLQCKKERAMREYKSKERKRNNQEITYIVCKRARALANFARTKPRVVNLGALVFALDAAPRATSQACHLAAVTLVVHWLVLRNRWSPSKCLTSVFQQLVSFRLSGVFMQAVLVHRFSNCIAVWCVDSGVMTEQTRA